MSAALGWSLAVLAGLVVLLIVQTVYLSVVLRWSDEQTVGLAYYGKSPEGRRHYKRILRLHALLLSPILWLMRRSARLDFRRLAFQFEGIAGPYGSCSPESFAEAKAYPPRDGDVFVVTQMKCGTTWMQHVVYEVLRRGGGDLVASGTAMYAVSPWLEGRKSVSLSEAPVVGAERPSRIIKTHLPAELCPHSPGARYIYVVRHPVACFASCVDFVSTNAGGMRADLAVFEAWFCSKDLMWWGTWPAHVHGWWERSRGRANVLVVGFEEMKQDLAAVVRRVADFLGMRALSDAETAAVVEKCGFAYMQRHQDNFEMQPPHLLQTHAALFVRGSADRHLDVPADVRHRIMAWSGAGMAGSDFPLEAMYPDVARATEQ